MSNINVQYKNIFVHVPKCAGVSMEKQYFVGGSSHDTLYQLSRKPEFDPNFLKWAFVRNPYTRIASAYHFVKTRHKDEYVRLVLDPGRNFASFVANLDRNIRLDYKNEKNDLIHGYMIHFFPQSYFIKSNLYKLDFIGRFENIVSDWKEITKRISENCGKEIHNQLPHANKTKNKPPDYMRLYTPAMKEIVYWIYKEDFEMFGYEK